MLETKLDLAKRNINKITQENNALKAKLEHDKEGYQKLVKQNFDYN